MVRFLKMCKVGCSLHWYISLISCDLMVKFVFMYLVIGNHMVHGY